MFEKKEEIKKATRENIGEIVKCLEKEDEGYIVAAFNGCQCMVGEAEVLLSMITGMLHTLYENGIPKEVLEKTVELACLKKDELKEETLSKLDELIKKMKDLIGE